MTRAASDCTSEHGKNYLDSRLMSDMAIYRQLALKNRITVRRPCCSARAKNEKCNLRNQHYPRWLPRPHQDNCLARCAVALAPSIGQAFYSWKQLSRYLEIWIYFERLCEPLVSSCLLAQGGIRSGEGQLSFCLGAGAGS